MITEKYTVRRLNAVVRAKRQMVATDRLMQLAIVNRGLSGGAGYAELQRAIQKTAPGDQDHEKKQ